MKILKKYKDDKYNIIYNFLGKIFKSKYRNIQKEILEQLTSMKDEMLNLKNENKFINNSIDKIVTQNTAYFEKNLEQLKYIKDEIAAIKSQLNEKVDKSINNSVERLVTQNTANFVLANMSKAKIFTSEFDVLSYAISQAKKDGLFLEFGVYQARTINYIAKQILDNTIYGFDSFEGLPEDWRIGFEKGIFGLDKLPTVDPNVELIKGWFNDTLPTFIDSHKDDCAFMHIDCDLYSSTKTIFNYLGNKIKKGTIIVFDEYFNYPGWEEHEHKAFMEFVMSNNIKFEYIAYNEKHEQVAIKIM